MFPRMAACSATLHLGVCPQGGDHIKPQFVSKVKAGLNYMHVTKGGSLCLWDAVFARGFKQSWVLGGRIDNMGDAGVEFWNSSLWREFGKIFGLKFLILMILNKTDHEDLLDKRNLKLALSALSPSTCQTRKASMCVHTGYSKTPYPRKCVRTVLGKTPSLDSLVLLNKLAAWESHPPAPVRSDRRSPVVGPLPE
uniref:Uncharacterized protein n=1 Tax=Timema shepardi TaxID=629360 RepID=A0A7R9FZG2_TIMSH|nr:unnamed protein product [Timema shepardi]